MSYMKILLAILPIAVTALIESIFKDEKEAMPLLSFVKVGASRFLMPRRPQVCPQKSEVFQCMTKIDNEHRPKKNPAIAGFSELL